MSIDQRIIEATEQLESDVKLTYDIVNGDDNTEVSTEGGMVPSHAKVAKDSHDEIINLLQPTVSSINDHADFIIDKTIETDAHADKAEIAKVAAEKARDDTAAIAYEGDATVEPGPGKLAIADSDGHFKQGWMPPFIKDAYRHAVESATGGKNTVLYDTHGNANVMVVIPKFTYDELQMTVDMGTGVCTAFLKDGVEMPEIFIGKYLASGSQAVSMPSVDPRASINFDSAKSACQAKGAGWHLMSVHEWSAISLWCIANGVQPRGNTEYGRAHDKKWEFGKRYDGRLPNDRSGTGRTNCGSGPATWAHDQTNTGVYDLVGNVWEWQDLLKTQDGQIICTPDNDDTTLEAQWIAQECFFDSPQSGGAESGFRGEQFLNSQVTKYAGPVGDNGYYGDNYRTWESITKDPSYVSNELMKRLMIEPSGKNIQGRMYIRNYGERLPVRGGDWLNGSYAGLAALYLSRARSYVSGAVGFRPAFAL